MKIIRNEIKYYINYKKYLIMYEILKKFLKLDPNSIKTNRFIRSLYFDTINDDNFYEKVAGIKNRKKYRLRIYDLNTRKVKFEIKNKFDNQILKQTAVISKNDAIEVQKGNYEVMLKYNNPILNKAYLEFAKKYYKPVVLVDYLRDPFIYAFNDVRITFDKCLQCNTTDLNLFKNPFMKNLINKNKVIMEIKYNSFLPNHIKRILKFLPFERCAISKYCMGRIERFKIRSTASN